ncbi:alpha/beta hydrolase fold domain-containing protein [Actinomycetospora sp. CA-101289]|uniref:alpha/beta hydrolase fold domain-containing protein n=1 Tax=Actinomycetospora sp. CA-101289 TaxID=3239893 RepID=UPI003D97B198
MTSLAGRVMPLALALRRTKKVLASADATRAQVDARVRRPARAAPPRWLRTRADVTVSEVAGWPVYDVGPRGGSPSRRVLYLHGGAYVAEVVLHHWLFVARLAAATDSRVRVPIYPLAPTATADRVVPAVTDLAADLVDTAGPADTVLMGDSAGGGLALAAAQGLRDRGVPAPAHTVLISPWLDVGLGDPAIAATERRDPMLAVAGLRAAGDLYRGDLAADDPVVSPLHGDLDGLGPVTVFSGTRDVLHPDAERFADVARAAGVPLRYRPAPEMLHVYPLLPIPEARAARRTIRSVITGGSGPPASR